VALDATLRGFRVALIDKGDFASGTSSVSSKLVHGGLRYLEHGHFRLVHEALHERRRLLENAPHLVRPLRFVLPFYHRARVRPWQWRIGLTLYDLLAGADKIRPSRVLTTERLRREFPDLRGEGLAGGAEYCDAAMDDARLCLEVLLTAARHGAIVANYIEAIGFVTQGGVVRGVRAVDHVGGAEFTVGASQVLNATGPWADAVGRLAGDPQAPYLRPTKGVHLLAPGRGLNAAFLFLHPADGRVFFIIPWMGKTLIGTTDTLTDESPDALTVTPAEIAYLLDGHNHYLAPALTPADVLGTFAGLRPLIRDRPDEPARLSREFRLFASPTGLLTAVGGKYTTYRSMAETITDVVERRLGRRRPPRTARFPLDGAPPGGWEDFAPRATAELAQRWGLSEASAEHLVRRYGRHAADVCAYLEKQPALARAVVAGEPDLLVEFAYQRDAEMAVRPADFLLRRTRLGLFHPELLRHPPAGTQADPRSPAAAGGAGRRVLF
jgi:glycerol-3-phosphate dehydrogenase